MAYVNSAATENRIYVASWLATRAEEVRRQKTAARSNIWIAQSAALGGAEAIERLAEAT